MCCVYKHIYNDLDFTSRSRVQLVKYTQNFNSPYVTYRPFRNIETDLFGKQWFDCCLHHGISVTLRLATARLGRNHAGPLRGTFAGTHVTCNIIELGVSGYSTLSLRTSIVARHANRQGRFRNFNPNDEPFTLSNPWMRLIGFTGSALNTIVLLRNLRLFVSWNFMSAP